MTAKSRDILLALVRDRKDALSLAIARARADARAVKSEVRIRALDILKEKMTDTIAAEEELKAL